MDLEQFNGKIIKIISSNFLYKYSYQKTVGRVRHRVEVHFGSDGIHRGHVDHPGLVSHRIIKFDTICSYSLKHRFECPTLPGRFFHFEIGRLLPHRPPENGRGGEA